MNRWELPEGWEWTTIGAVGEVRLGRQRTPEHHNGPNMRPYLRVANVHEGRIDTSDVKEMNFTDAEFEIFKLREGDVLLNEGQSKEFVGRPAIFKGEVPGACFQNTLVRFRASDDVNPEFAFQLFRHYMHAGHFQEIAKITTSIAHLGGDRFAARPFPLPPRSEQDLIAERLNALQTRITTARAGLDELRQLAAALKRSVLDAAFRGDLTTTWREAHPDTEPASALLDRLRAERRRRWQEAHPKKPYIAPEPVDPTDLPELPEGWCWAALGELIAEGPTNGYSGPVGVTGTPTLRLSATTRGELLLNDDTTKRLEETIPPGSSYFLRDGDLLVQRANSLEYIGAAAIYRGPSDAFIYPDLMMRLRAAPGLEVEHLWRWLNGTICHTYLRERATGTAGGMPKINGQTLVTAPVPLAPQPEQRQIAAIIASAWSTANHALDAARALADDLTTTEHALLTAAFRGELLPPAAP